MDTIAAAQYLVVVFYGESVMAIAKVMVWRLGDAHLRGHVSESAPPTSIAGISSGVSCLGGAWNNA